MNQYEKINYVEFPSRDLSLTKRFFSKAFQWSFEDYGPESTAFLGAGLDGGFYAADQVPTPASGAALIVFYSEDLDATQSKVEAAGGTIVKATFAFPCGRRFHFAEPSGNEFSAWSDRALYVISKPKIVTSSCWSGICV